MKSIESFRRLVAAFLIVVCVPYLTSCASTKALTEVSPPGGDKALVYFIRKHYPPFIHEARIIVNGEKVATVANNNYIAVNVPIGQNKINIEVTDGKPFAFEMAVANAERLYVVITGDVTTIGVRATGIFINVALQWGFQAYPVSAEEANQIVAEMGEKLE